MKAVILCAGEGERLKPLTEKIPKPLILIKDKPILSFIFSSLPPKIKEVFVIIKEKHLGLFEEFLRKEDYDFSVKFLFQDPKKKGTYFALMTAREYLKEEDKFLVLNGDDIFLKEDLKRLIDLPSPCYGLGCKRLDKRYRTCDLDEAHNKITSFRKQTEGELERESPCFSGAFTLNKIFFFYEPVFYEEGEAGIPHTLFANCQDVSYIILKKWFQINTKDDLIIVQEGLKFVVDI